MAIKRNIIFTDKSIQMYKDLLYTLSCYIEASLNSYFKLHIVPYVLNPGSSVYTLINSGTVIFDSGSSFNKNTNLRVIFKRDTTQLYMLLVLILYDDNIVNRLFNINNIKIYEGLGFTDILEPITNFLNYKKFKDYWTTNNILLSLTSFNNDSALLTSIKITGSSAVKSLYNTESIPLYSSTMYSLLYNLIALPLTQPNFVKVYLSKVGFNISNLSDTLLIINKLNIISTTRIFNDLIKFYLEEDSNYHIIVQFKNCNVYLNKFDLRLLLKTNFLLNEYLYNVLIPPDVTNSIIDLKILLYGLNNLKYLLDVELLNFIVKGSNLRNFSGNIYITSGTVTSSVPTSSTLYNKLSNRFKASTNIVKGRLILILSGSNDYVKHASNINVASILGVSLNNASVDQYVLVAYNGNQKILYTGSTPTNTNVLYYLDIDGKVTQTPPDTGKYLVYIGNSVSNIILQSKVLVFLTPQQPIYMGT